MDDIDAKPRAQEPAQLEKAFRANMGSRRHMGEAPGGLKIKRS